MTARTPCVPIFVVFLASSLSQADETSQSAADPHRVVGYEQCSKCHQAEIDVWQRTPHHQTFDTLHRKPEANAIAERLGLRSIKRNDVCIECHYTQQQQGSRIKPVAGISCESCHGAAADWLELHNDYGGPHVAREQESAAHKQQRRERSIAKGMRNPSNLYLVAQSCLACHTTPNEQLVDVGGHAAGSGDFELVSWSQGMVRHNFSRSNGQRNDISSPDRLRLMFVVGRLADLEYSLRATAEATKKGKFALASAQRAHRVRMELAQIQSLIREPLLDAALAAALSAKLKLHNADELAAAAEMVGEAAFAFAEQADGSTLSALDRLLPTHDQYK